MSRVDAAVSITKPKPKQKSKADAQWTGAIIELVEFIYGAAELCSFNNGHIFLNEFIRGITNCTKKERMRI